MRTVRVNKLEDEHLNDSVSTTTIMERTGKSGIGFREAFIQFQVGDVQGEKDKKDNKMAGFFLRTLTFELPVSVNDDMFRGTSAMGGMSAMA